MLVLAGALGTPASAAAQERAGWLDPVQRVLDRRAEAVLVGDRAAFAATMADAPAGFRRARLAWFDRVTSLPLTRYELSLDDGEYLDLAAAARALPTADEAHVVVVRERIAFGAFDVRPATEELILTVARRQGRWSVVGDDALEDLGIFSARNIWDLGAVRSTRVGPVLAITRGSIEQAAGLAREVGAAIGYVGEQWPLTWSERAVLVVPSSARELERIFETTVDLSPFVAFASFSVPRADDGSVRPSGPRIYLQPDTYFDQPASFRREVLSHEVLHVAAGHRSGVFTPSWLEEGVALTYGERAAPSTSILAARVRDGSFPGRAPEGHEFFLGTSTDINASYEASAHLVSWLADRFGADAPARFYAALGRESAVSIGTHRYHLDRASRRVFGRSFGSIERAWVRVLERRFG